MSQPSFALSASSLNADGLSACDPGMLTENVGVVVALGLGNVNMRVIAPSLPGPYT